MGLPKFTEGMIRQYASDQSFRRGEAYYNSGSVLSLVVRGDVIQAEVEGSQYSPYRVLITFDVGGITNALCDCPYDWGGWCKHVVGVLLACIHEPEKIEKREPLDKMLADLDQEQLQTVLMNLVEQNPNLADQIEGQILILRSTGSQMEVSAKESPLPRKKPVDAAPFRRQVSDILRSLDHMRSSEAYWHVGGTVDQVGQVLDQAQIFVEAGDGRNALVILEAITDEYVKNWIYLDDSDGFAGEFFGDLGPVWVEAILSADLTAAEGKVWADKLTEWQAEVGDYGIDDSFDTAQAAAIQGWDYPSLQRVLQGEITNKGIWENAPPWYADDLAVARLNVLERQERYQEYLYLAEAEGQTARYAAMLARLDP